MKHMMTLAAGLAAAVLCHGESRAQLDAYIGDVILVGFSFCPPGYHEADGSLMAINENEALFALVGTTYGGDGQTSFGLPDLRGRIPVGAGQTPGMTPVMLGQKVGVETVTLTTAQLAPHTHTVLGTSEMVDTVSPENATPGTFAVNRYRTDGVDVIMDHDMVSTEGGVTPVDVRAPTLGLRYCIATEGIYPTQN
ncbi:MAG: phage tail protein [Oceanicaulis sp.]|nr:phage tail protein [Oceanicaulis sp.]